MKRRREISLKLHETLERLTFEMRVNGEAPFSLAEEKPKAVRVRLPLPSPETLLRNSSRWAETDRSRTAKGHLWFYIQCRERGIAEQLAEIRKSARRIEKELQCIRIANAVMPKLK